MGPLASVSLLPGSSPHTRVSLHTGGGQISTSGSKNCSYPSVSADGNRIAFATTAEDTPAGTGTNSGNVFQMWTRNLTSGQAHLVSGITHTATGRIDPAAAGSNQGAVNGSGKFVVFQSFASDFTVYRQTQLGKPDINQVDDVWIYDTVTFRLSRLSSRPYDGAGGNGRSDGPPEASNDGQWVTFTTCATNLVNTDTTLGDCGLRPRGGGETIVLLDRGQPNLDVEPETYLSSREIHWVSHGVAVQYQFPSGEPFFLDCVQPNGPSKEPSLSANGCKIAYRSQATNLSVQDNFNPGVNPVWHVYVHDRATGTNELVSKSTAGVRADDDCFWPEISADGRFVVFVSFARLDSTDTNDVRDIYIRDLQAGTTRLVTYAQTGIPFFGDGHTGMVNPEISPSGRFFTYAGLIVDPLVAFNPTPRDYTTVLLYDIDANHDGILSTAFNPSEFEVQHISLTPAGNDANHQTGGPLMFGTDGEFVYFRSDASDLIMGDTNGLGPSRG